MGLDVQTYMTSLVFVRGVIVGVSVVLRPIMHLLLLDLLGKCDDVTCFSSQPKRDSRPVRSTDSELMLSA